MTPSSTSKKSAQGFPSADGKPPMRTTLVAERGGRRSRALSGES